MIYCECKHLHVCKSFRDVHIFTDICEMQITQKYVQHETFYIHSISRVIALTSLTATREVVLGSRVFSIYGVQVYMLM